MGYRSYKLNYVKGAKLPVNIARSTLSLDSTSYRDPNNLIIAGVFFQLDLFRASLRK